MTFSSTNDVDKFFIAAADRQIMHKQHGLQGHACADAAKCATADSTVHMQALHMK